MDKFPPRHVVRSQFPFILDWEVGDARNETRGLTAPARQAHIHCARLAQSSRRAAGGHRFEENWSRLVGRTKPDINDERVAPSS
jgi:hypothetical protein